MLWKPTADFEAILTAEYYNSSSAGFYYKEVTGINDTNGINGNFSTVDSKPGGNRGAAHYVDGNLRLKYHSGDWELTSITALEQNYNNTALDQDLQSLDIYTARRKDVLRSLSQELRAEYKSGPADVIIGGYYSRDKLADSSQILLGSDFFVPYLRGFLIVNPNVLRTTEDGAAFVDATYQVTSRLELGAGVRYDVTGVSATVINASDTFVNVDPRVTARYKVDNDTNIYFTAARGYRSGGFNAGAAIGTPYQTFQPDKLWSFDAGFKTRQLRDHLQLDGSIFFIAYDNFNSTNFVPLPSGPALLTTALARHADSYGFDLNANYRVTNNLSLYAVLGYDHTKLMDVIFVPDTPHLVAQGAPITGVPLWNADVGATYERPIPGTDLTWNLTGDVTYTGKTSEGADPIQYRNDFAEVNLSAGIGYKNWTITVFGKNIFDNKSYELFVPGTLFASGNPDAKSVALPNLPARYGVRLDGRF